MLLEVLRCCFSTSTGLGNLSHDATLVIASLCGSWVQQTAVGSVLLRIARLGCSARDRVAKPWLRWLYPQWIGDPYQMATGSGSSWSGHFQTTLPTVLGLVLSVSALNHTVRVSRAAAIPGAGIIGLRILMIALGGEWVTRFHF